MNKVQQTTETNSRLFMSRNQLLALAFHSHWKTQEVQSNCLNISRIPQSVIEVEQIRGFRSESLDPFQQLKLPRGPVQLDQHEPESVL
jgi:hypothetical protein